MRKIVFLPSTRSDLRWFHDYYASIFPEGHTRAVAHYRTILSALRENPQLGRPVPERNGVRKLPIPRTPFMLIYRVTPTRIEILRLLDARSNT